MMSIALGLLSMSKLSVQYLCTISEVAILCILREVYSSSMGTSEVLYMEFVFCTASGGFPEPVPY